MKNTPPFLLRPLCRLLLCTAPALYLPGTVAAGIDLDLRASLGSGYDGNVYYDSTSRDDLVSRLGLGATLAAQRPRDTLSLTTDVTVRHYAANPRLAYPDKVVQGSWKGTPRPAWQAGVVNTFVQSKEPVNFSDARIADQLYAVNTRNYFSATVSHSPTPVTSLSALYGNTVWLPPQHSNAATTITQTCALSARRSLSARLALNGWGDVTVWSNRMRPAMLFPTLVGGLDWWLSRHHHLDCGLGIDLSLGEGTVHAWPNLRAGWSWQPTRTARLDAVAATELASYHYSQEAVREGNLQVKATDTLLNQHCVIGLQAQYRHAQYAVSSITVNTLEAGLALTGRINRRISLPFSLHWLHTTSSASFLNFSKTAFSGAIAIEL